MDHRPEYRADEGRSTDGRAGLVSTELAERGIAGCARVYVVFSRNFTEELIP